MLLLLLVIIILFLMLQNSNYWRHLKLTVQIQLALQPCYPFSINNHDMTDNSVEKYYCVVFDVKRQVKLRFKMFCWFLKLFYNIIYGFVIGTTTNTAYFAQPYSNNHHLIYGLNWISKANSLWRVCFNPSRIPIRSTMQKRGAVPSRDFV